MKSRLSSTLGLHSLFGRPFAFLGVLMLAYSAGRESGAGSQLLRAVSIPGANQALLGAVGLVLAALVHSPAVAPQQRRVLKPAGELARSFPERLASGDARARVEIAGSGQSSRSLRRKLQP